jgi:hypothetical protein
MSVGSITTSHATGSTVTVTLARGSGSSTSTCLRADAVRLNGPVWATSGLGGNAGDSIYAYSSSAQATYSFTELTGAKYEVFATTPAEANSTTSAIYSVAGGAALGTVNQKTTSGWQSLGMVDVTGETLTITLGKSAPGVLRADAVKLVDHTTYLSVTATDAAEEGPVSGGFVVTRSGNIREEQTVTVSLTGSSSDGAADYYAIYNSQIYFDGSTISITFPAETDTSVTQQSTSIEIVPIDDTDFEYDELVELSLSSSEDYKLVTGSDLEVEIEDNDLEARSDSYFTTNTNTLYVQAAQGVLQNDRFDSNLSYSVALSVAPSQADGFSLNSDGSFEYDPADGFEGIDSFTYSLTVGDVSTTAEAIITVLPERVYVAWSTDDAQPALVYYELNLADVATSRYVSLNDVTSTGNPLITVDWGDGETNDGSGYHHFEEGLQQITVSAAGVGTLTTLTSEVLDTLDTELNDGYYDSEFTVEEQLVIELPETDPILEDSIETVASNIGVPGVAPYIVESYGPGTSHADDPLVIGDAIAKSIARQAPNRVFIGIRNIRMIFGWNEVREIPGGRVVIRHVHYTYGYDEIPVSARNDGSKYRTGGHRTGENEFNNILRRQGVTPAVLPNGVKAASLQDGATLTYEKNGDWGKMVHVRGGVTTTIEYITAIKNVNSEARPGGKKADIDLILGPEQDIIAEEKSALGFSDPVIYSKVFKTPQKLTKEIKKFVRIQIVEPTQNRIEQLQVAANFSVKSNVRGLEYVGPAELISIEKLRQIKKFQFFIKGTLPELQAEVENGLDQLRNEFGNKGYTFEVFYP